VSYGRLIGFASRALARAVTTGAGLSQAYLGGALLATSLCPLPAMNFLFLSSQKITQITDQHQLAFSLGNAFNAALTLVMQCPNQVMLGNFRIEGLIGSTRALVARLRYCPKEQLAVVANGTVGRHMKEYSSEPPRSAVSVETARDKIGSPHATTRLRCG
jgi:hypothetical protein